MNNVESQTETLSRCICIELATKSWRKTAAFRLSLNGGKGLGRDSRTGLAVLYAPQTLEILSKIPKTAQLSPRLTAPTGPHLCPN
jgi:hypothetical protein